MKAFVLSGGASKGAFTAGVMRYLIRKNVHADFSLAIGTSTGSLVGGPALLGDDNYLNNIYTNVHNSDVFRNSLIYWFLNQIYKIGPIDASMAPLTKLVRKYYILDGKLDELIRQNKEFIVTTVNVYTGKVVYVSTRQVESGEISKETFVRAIVASCSEPVFTEPIRVFANEVNSRDRNVLFYDGGVREFLPFQHAMNLGADEIWAISTHQIKTDITEWGDNTSPDKVNLLKALGWTIGTLLNEVERGDLFRACVGYRLGFIRSKIKEVAQNNDISNQVIDQFMDICDDMFPGINMTVPKLHVITPQTPMETSLEFDPAVMQNYFADGELDAERYFRNGAPEFIDCVRLLL
ncbi:MAG: patatin-like phospholipase family protein [Candidatus Zixiibacteriota bacterium]